MSGHASPQTPAPVHARYFTAAVLSALDVHCGSALEPPGPAAAHPTVTRDAPGATTHSNAIVIGTPDTSFAVGRSSGRREMIAADRGSAQHDPPGEATPWHWTPAPAAHR
jgi:hypothetical protein